LTGNDLKIPAGRRFRLNEPSVIADVIDGETIIMNLAKGDYYSLNLSGGELWQLLLSGLDREEILRAIAQRYRLAPSVGEIDAFIDRLIGFHLVVPTEHSNGAMGAGEHATPGAWSTPEISVYGDMKELLAMDPPLPLVKPARN
jgi:Coenzyme PQQ synthesis protein D (PqqD)